MKITILGAGNVGATLGKRFAEKGHEIYFGVPQPEKYASAGLPGQVGTVGNAARAAEIILLAVPYDAVNSALAACGDVAGKIIIDATNPLGMTDSGLALVVGFETSGAEQIAAVANGAKVVKCFNQTGADNMARPNHSMMFVCGDDADAVETVRQLAAEIGFDALSFGQLKQARLLEPLAMTWIYLAFNSELKRNFAFGILRT